MKIKIITLFLIVFVAVSYAHDANKAYFDIEFKNDTTYVLAEFPWTIRNALITYDTSFTAAKTAEAISDIVFKYVVDNFKLYDSNDNQLHLKEVTLLKNTSHSHATNYKFVFEGADVVKVENTLLFNVAKSQENYHILEDEDLVKQKVVTKSSAPFFIVKEEKSNKTIFYTLVFLLVVVILFFVVNRKRKI